MGGAGAKHVSAPLTPGTITTSLLQIGHPTAAAVLGGYRCERRCVRCPDLRHRQRDQDQVTEVVEAAGYKLA